uniref:Proteasome assembly chaperone 3 n=1 Tax=Strongyloides venezuelensis TaxID=75913 RepID=A0A0K0FGJ9_STRVS
MKLDKDTENLKFLRKKKELSQISPNGSLVNEKKKNKITEVPVTCLIVTGFTRAIITESVYRAVTKKDACNLTLISFNLPNGSTRSLMGVANIAVCRDGDFSFMKNQKQYLVMVGSDLSTATNTCINYGTNDVTLEACLKLVKQIKVRGYKALSIIRPALRTVSLKAKCFLFQKTIKSCYTYACQT